ncbi:MAG: TetR/AcrR family transcriptional regulator [Halanaerobiales bacterium]
MPKSTFLNLDMEKKDRIIEASIDEFAANSFHKASVTNIIKNAEIASGSFYQYFKGKEDLYKYLINILVERKLDYIDQEVMKKPEELSFFEFLRKLYQGGIEFAKENPRLVSIGKNLMNNNCEICKKIREQQKPQSNEFFKNILKRAIENGDVKEDIDPELTAKFLTSVNYSLSDFIYTEDGLNEDIMDVINVLINIIENGIKNDRSDY